jgi:hypothetical protein
MKRIVVIDVRAGGTAMIDDLREQSETRFGAGS